MRAERVVGRNCRVGANFMSAYQISSVQLHLRRAELQRNVLKFSTKYRENKLLGAKLRQFRAIRRLIDT